MTQVSRKYPATSRANVSMSSLHRPERRGSVVSIYMKIQKLEQGVKPFRGDRRGGFRAGYEST